MCKKSISVCTCVSIRQHDGGSLWLLAAQSEQHCLCKQSYFVCKIQSESMLLFFVLFCFPYTYLHTVGQTYLACHLSKLCICMCVTLFAKRQHFQWKCTKMAIQIVVNWLFIETNVKKLLHEFFSETLYFSFFTTFNHCLSCIWLFWEKNKINLQTHIQKFEIIEISFRDIHTMHCPSFAFNWFGLVNFSKEKKTLSL